MNQQFQFIHERLHNTSFEVNRLQENFDTETYIISSALAASIILNNLRRIQQTLIDTITDISHGQIDGRLLHPEQLMYETSIISGQLKGDLTLPVDRNNIKDLYKLLKVSCLVHLGYLIIEIKIPLLSNDQYELDRIISIPQTKNENQTRIVVPRMQYIAYDLNKDTASLLSENDLQSCVRTNDQRTLCAKSSPIYDLNIKQSICDIQLLDDGPACATTITNCRDKWIKLHRTDNWLFSCCRECHVRIYCASSMTIKDLKGAGIIYIEKGCLLKGDYFTLYAHNNFFNQIHVHPALPTLKVSILNRIINTSVSEDIAPPQLTYHSDTDWNQLQEKINDIKRNSESQLTIHDVHQYSLLYIVVTVLLLAAAVAAFIRYKDGILRRQLAGPEATVPTPQQCETSVNASSDVISEVITPIQCVPSEIKRSVLSVNMGTSPMPLRSRFAEL